MEGFNNEDGDSNGCCEIMTRWIMAVQWTSDQKRGVFVSNFAAEELVGLRELRRGRILGEAVLRRRPRIFFGAQVGGLGWTKRTPRSRNPQTRHTDDGRR